MQVQKPCPLLKAVPVRKDKEASIRGVLSPVQVLAITSMQRRYAGGIEQTPKSLG